MSREHVLPKSAGNATNTRFHSLNSFAAGRRTGDVYRGGLTRKSFCRKCNSFIGHEYVPAFARWTEQASQYFSQIDGDNVLLIPFSFSPLPVAKQLAAMVLAMAFEGSIDMAHYQELRRFVLQPTRRNLPDDFQFWTYFHLGPPTMEGPFAAIDTSGGPSPVLYCHVGRQPLGYAVTGNDGASLAWARKLQLANISHFSRLEPNEVRACYMRLPCLHGEMPFRPL